MKIEKIPVEQIKFGPERLARIEEFKKHLKDLDKNIALNITLEKAEKGRQVGADLRAAAEAVGKKVKVQKTKDGYGVYVVETRGRRRKRQ
jgi:hypothetical protein